MKIARKILMIALIGIIVSGLPTKASTNVTPLSDPDAIPLVLKEQEPLVDPNAPRTPAHIPVLCSLDDATGYLYFTFLFPMGDVTITLTEASAGVVSSDEYSTASCLVSIPVPASGTYEITLVLESGAEYVGSFVY